MKLRLQYVQHAQQLYRSKLEELKKRPDWQPVTCGQGCHACCSEPLHVNLAEAKVMVKSIPTLEVDGVKERTRQWVEKAEASGLLKEKLPSAFDWLSFKMVCPLLKNGLCLVYDNRPFGCRSHNAIGDPALCHSAEGRKTQKYFNCPELEQMTMTTLLAASPLVDHLGVFLSEMLLNRPVPSAARQRFPFEFEKVSGPKNAAVLHLKFTGDAKS